MSLLDRTLIGRRGFLRGTALGGVGLATAAVIGCDDDDDDDDDAASTAPAAPAAPSGAAAATPAAATPEPRVSAEVEFGVSASGETLDPNSASRRPIEWHAIYETTGRIVTDPATSKTTIEPSLANSWAVDANDKRKWVFNLRESEWSDGKKLTAEDVLFTIAYAADADNKSRLISRINLFESGRVIDDKTVEFTTKSPDATWGHRMTFAFVIPKHVFEDASTGPEKQAVEPVTSGAYSAGEYRQQQSVEMLASPSSWRGTKGFDRAVLNIITEHTTRVAALEVGDVAFIDRPPLPDLERTRGFDKVEVDSYPAFGVVGMHYQPNPGDPWPTVDPRVRTALNHAVDNKSIVDTIYFGTGDVMNGQFVPKAVLGHNPGIKPYDFDPDLARSLLKDAGFPDGFQATIQTHELNAQALPYAVTQQSYYEDVGVKTDIRTMDIATWRDGLYGRMDRAAIFSNTWNATSMYEASFALGWYKSSNPARFYVRDWFDEMYDEALTVFDDEARGRIYQDIFARMRDDNPGLWTMENVTYHAWREDVFKGHTARTDPDMFLDSAIPA